MKKVDLKITAPIDFDADCQARLGVFYNGVLIGTYLIYEDEFCVALSYLDMTQDEPKKRVIQGCLSGYAYKAKSMGEQISIDLARMGYECEGNWVADSKYDYCLFCIGYTEEKGMDKKSCKERQCIMQYTV